MATLWAGLSTLRSSLAESTRDTHETTDVPAHYHSRGLCFQYSDLATLSARAGEEPGPPLPGTQPLTMAGDIASTLVEGVDRFLLREIAESASKRAAYWKRDFSTAEAYKPRSNPTASGWRTFWGCAINAGGGRRSQIPLVDSDLLSWLGFSDPMAGIRRCDWRGSGVSDRAPVSESR